MKPNQLIISVATLAVLGGVAFLAKRSGNKADTPAAELRGSMVVDPNSLNDIKGIQLKDAEAEVNLTRKNNQWVVADRDDLPADAGRVRSLLVKLSETPVIQAMEAGESQNERMELLPPDGDGDADYKATQVTFKKEDGSELSHVRIGKSKSASSGNALNAQDPMAGGGKMSRYLRTSARPDLVLEVSDNFSDKLSGSGWPYGFSGIDVKVGDWLDKESFIDIKKIKSVAIAFKEEGKEGYTLTRESDTADFTIDSVPEGKELDASKVSSLKTVLSGASSKYDDVLTKEGGEKLDLSKAITATISTFEGFTYTIEIGPKDEDANNTPIRFTVAGEFETERKPEEGKEETEEEKKTADETFQKELKEKQDKLAKEKGLEGRWFAMPNYRVDPMLKPKADIIKDIEEEKEDDDATASAEGAVKVPAASIEETSPPKFLNQLPPGVGENKPKPVVPKPETPTTGRIEAVTPPVRVPPVSEGEGKIEAVTPPVRVPPVNENNGKIEAVTPPIAIPPIPEPSEDANKPEEASSEAEEASDDSEESDTDD